uniref:Reverse transcriptase domain-containing protein n=1 Tax=Haemonchus contortus TaxID=6289 RepID=A0A7I5E8S3_HAECO
MTDNLPIRNAVFSPKNQTFVATWNVRTLNQTGNLAQLLREFDEYRLDILGISEVRWLGTGRMTSGNKTVLHSGHENRHERGVGFVLSGRAAKALEGWNPVSDRIISARFVTRHTRITIIQTYAPTEDSNDDTKNDFYELLQDTIDNAPRRDLKIVLGDFNAKIIGNRCGFESTVGPFASSEELSNNGERLISFCDHNELCIGNTYFQHRQIHKKTWRSPDGRTLNEIDHVCISRRWRSSLQDFRVLRGADIGSDHYMVRAVVKLKLKKIRSTPFARPFAVEKLKDPNLASRLALEMRNRFDALEEITNLEDEWTAIRDTIKVCAEEVVGRRRGKRKEEWIKDSTWQKIDERKYAKLQREQVKTSRELEEAKRRYTELDRLVKKSCRDDKNDWLIRKGAEAQYAADHGDSKTLYRIVRELTGNRSNSNVPIRDKNGRLLSSSDEQNQRWLEYFRDILNQPSPSTTYCFDNTDPVEQLEVNTGYITKEEVSAAIECLKNRKSPGLDEISAELLKAGSTVVVEKLVKLFNRCWSQGEVPEDWRRGVIVKIPKKGNLSDCSNWRGITLLSVPGKTFCIVLLRRICTAIDGRLREEQAGFRSGRSCSEQIFTLRNIIEQCVEYGQPLVINFVDFKKAFDSIHRESLWAILKTYGVPQSFISIFKNLYLNSSCCVRTDTGYTPFFQIDTGVRQGCILSPILFNVCLDFVMRETMKEVRAGISWHDRSRLTDLDFADDIALIAEDENKLQQVTTCLSREASMIGLRISACKSKVMKVGFDQTQLNISVDDTTLETVGNFFYLGSTITHNGDAEMEVRIRIAKAAAVFRRLQPLWASSSISQNIKLRLYYSIVIPTALYASETWKSTASLVKRLNAFHQRCLRRIMKIRYTDHVTNEEVLRRCGSNCLHVVVAQRRLRLAGHILRMAQQRVSRVAMNWIPPGAKRGRGRPRNTWRRTFENDLKTINVSRSEGEMIAQDRQQWKNLVARCALQHGRN